MTQDELNKIEKKALEQLTTGKSLFGKDFGFANCITMSLELPDEFVVIVFVGK